MLKKQYRLDPTKKLVPLFVFRNPFFTCKIAKNEVSFFRIGIIISKKIDKRAVVRNSMRRIIHQCIKGILTNFKKGYDLLFIVNKSFGKEEKEKVCQEINIIFRKANLF